jgi:hypothetical protein
MKAGILRWLPWALAALWFLFRWAIGEYHGYDFEKGQRAGVLANLLIILVLLFIALIIRHRSLPDGQGFMQDVKGSLGMGVRYLLGVTALMALYYDSVSPELEMRRSRDRAANAAAIDTPEELAAIKQENPHLKSYSAEQILKAKNDQTELMTGTGVILSTSFIALFFTTVLYAFLVTFIFRQFIRVT